MQTGYLLLNGNAPISTITILIDNTEMEISVIVKVLHNKKYQSYFSAIYGLLRPVFVSFFH